MDAAERERMRRYVARLDHARTTLAQELEDELVPLRGLSLTERGQWVASVCAAAAAIVRARRDRFPVPMLDEPPAPDFRDKWQALMARDRAMHRSAR